MATAFILNGLLFASLFARIPDLREGLDLSNGGLGLLLLAIAAGSLLALPASGRLVERFGAAGVVRSGPFSPPSASAWSPSVPRVSAVPVAAVGLFSYGVGTGCGTSR